MLSVIHEASGYTRWAGAAGKQGYPCEVVKALAEPRRWTAGWSVNTQDL